MLIALNKNDALTLQEIFKDDKNIKVIFPSSPPMRKFIKCFLQLNSPFPQVANAAMYKRIDFKDYDVLFEQFEEAISKINTVSTEMRQLLHKINPNINNNVKNNEIKNNNIQNNNVQNNKIQNNNPVHQEEDKDDEVIIED